MKLSLRTRMLAGFLLANGAILVTAATLMLTRQEKPPQIQGVMVAPARALPEFSLLDHHGQAFHRDDLMGHWHLVAYGFTSCPDICPTTLSQLDRFTHLLGPGTETPKILFYSVDHRRDTVARLAAYVPYFNPDFTGLTHLDDPDNPHLPFEQELGITARLEPDSDGTGYSVLHGVTLSLLSPEAELVAVFKPGQTAQGVRAFDPERLVADYRAVLLYRE